MNVPKNKGTVLQYTVMGTYGFQLGGEDVTFKLRVKLEEARGEPRDHRHRGACSL